MKKIIISIIMIILISSLLVTFTSSVFAADNFSLEKHDAKNDTDFSEAATTLSGIILTCIRFVGAGIAIISLILIAMKYLYSSPGEKADYKKNLLVYAIGGLGMFSVGTVLEIIQKLSEKVGGTSAPADPS